MGELEKYQRATDKELDSILLRNGMVRSQPALFSEIYDDQGNIILPEQLSRANEIQGAGIEYFISVSEYLYTHYLPVLKKNRNQNPLYDLLPTLDWGAFLDIASGGIKGQRERIEIAVMHYHAKPKPVLMFSADGHLHSRLPFVVDFDWGRTDKLDSKQAARLARLNKVKGKAKKDSYERLPIEKITIMAAKPLFEVFFKKDPSTYSFPTGMYAKLFDIANTTKKAMINLQKNPDVQTLDSNIYISAYARVMRFIMRHNNLTATQMKDKKTVVSIKSINAVDFFMSVYPSAINHVMGGKYIDYQKASRFLVNAVFMFFKIPDFKIYPVILLIRGMENLDITLFTDQASALKTWEAIANL